MLLTFNLEFTNDSFGTILSINSFVHGEPFEPFIHSVLHPASLIVLRILLPREISTMVIGRLYSAVIGSTAITMLYVLVKQILNRRTAVIAVLLFVFSPWVMLMDVSTSSIPLLTLWYMATLLAFAGKHYKACVLFGYLAGITRYEGVIVIAFLFLFALFWHGKSSSKLLLTIVAAGLAVPLTWLGFSYALTGDCFTFTVHASGPLVHKYLSYLPPAIYASKPLYFIVGLYQLLTPLIAYLSIFGIVLVLESRLNALNTLITTSSLFILFYMVLVVFDLVNLQEKYLIYPAVAFFIFAAYALSSIYTRVLSMRGIFKNNVINTAISGTILVLILVIPIFTSAFPGYELMNEYHTRNLTQRDVIDIISEGLPPNVHRNILIGAGGLGALMFFASEEGMNFSFYKIIHFPPDKIASLVAEGRTFIVFDEADLESAREYPFLAEYKSHEYGVLKFTPIGKVTSTSDAGNLPYYIRTILTLPTPKEVTMLVYEIHA